MARYEGWQERVHLDLYGGNGQTGVVPEIRTFLEIQKRRLNEAQWKAPVLVGLLAIVIPILYDISKHALGVK